MTESTPPPLEPAAPTHKHKFRYLLPPGTNFAFVAKFRPVVILSIFLMAASVGALFYNKAVHGSYMNWTIDFKGGTEVIFAFRDKTKASRFDDLHAKIATAQSETEKADLKQQLVARGAEFTKVDLGQVRDALTKVEGGIEVSEISSGEDGSGHPIAGIIVRSPEFSALKPETEAKALSAFLTQFKDSDIVKATWSGNQLHVRTTKALSWKAVADSNVFEQAGLDLKPWSPREDQQYTHADEGTGEFNAVFVMAGLDNHYKSVIEAAMPGIEAVVQNSYGVGAKAGDKLRDDAAKSIVYALFLIMLYLAFRFDIRYAPGAAFATIHDAVMVIGVFAITWTEVSLTSVAGLLTVMGFSVNDTVIVFDRIRENQAKLKDKKIERIVDISINEMLVRTILTSSTVLAVTLIMNIFGTGLVQNFAFAMNIGVIVGSYSSIFLAAPVFLWISKKWYSGPPRKRAVPLAARTAPVAEE